MGKYIDVHLSEFFVLKLKKKKGKERVAQDIK
jgi:hypothetical protein